MEAEYDQQQDEPGYSPPEDEHPEHAQPLPQEFEAQPEMDPYAQQPAADLYAEQPPVDPYAQQPPVEPDTPPVPPANKPDGLRQRSAKSAHSARSDKSRGGLMSALEANIDLDRVERQRRLKAKQKQLVYATRSLIETLEVCQPSIEAWIRYLLGLDEFDADYERLLERLKQVKTSKENKPDTIGINSKAMRAVGARDEVKDDGDEIDYVLFKQLAGRPLSALSATASDSTHSQLPPPRLVKVRAVFIKVGEVDTMRQTVQAELFLQFRWHEPELDGLTKEELSELTESNTLLTGAYWRPGIILENARGERPQRLVESRVNERGETWLTEKRIQNCYYEQELDLHDFPLDTQRLMVKLVSEKNDREVRLELDDEHGNESGIVVDSFADKQEWDLYKKMEVEHERVVNKHTPEQEANPALILFMTASRKPGYFYWNVILVMSVIAALCFTIYALEYKVEGVGDRLKLTLVLILTTITFKFSAGASLPVLPYLTVVDIYMNSMITFCCLHAVWHALTSMIMKSVSSSTMDTLMFTVIGVLASMYFALHFVLIGWFIYKHWKRRQIRRELNG